MRKEKYTKESLELAVGDSKSWADVCRYFGVKPATGTQTHIKNRAVSFNINTAHFIGQSYNRGRIPWNKRDIKFYLVKNGPFINSSQLLNKLVKSGIKTRQCEMCSNTTWLGHDIPLELDHKDNNHYNNELNNLSVLCPTCHALRHKLDKNASVM